MTTNMNVSPERAARSIIEEIPKASDTTLATFIWKNAEDLWGDFKHTDFGKIILPFTLLRRLECVLESTRDAVLSMHDKVKDKGIDVDLVLRQTAGLPFYNTSQYSLATLGATKTKSNLEAYIAGFSDNARVIFDQFHFTDTIARLARADNLFKICQNFASTDLHPNVVTDRVMSNIYEHLIRRFGAEVNEAAEDFMTPRDVVHLATTLLLDPDDELFRNNPGLIRTLYDPTCGTGGFLTDAMNHVDGFRNRDKVPPVLIPYGQELEPETHAVALASMLLRRLETELSRDLSANIAGPASTLSKDAFTGKRFNYCLANPPFGKKWEKDQAFVEREAAEKGFEGRFGAGTPRVSDGSMLFVQHLIDKLETPEKGGGRAAIVLSGSPLFTGNAGQGESEIRRWLLENDYIEAIVALPNDIFFRTGIGTYIWLLTNKKDGARKGKVQLINATGIHSPMRKSEGNKRRYISGEQIAEIACLYASFETGECVRIVDYREFGYRRIKVQRPLRLLICITKDGIGAFQSSKAFAKMDEVEQSGWIELLRSYLGETYPYSWLETLAALAKDAGLSRLSKPLSTALESALGVRDSEAPVVKVDGSPVADKELEDFENVPLGYSVDDYLAAEVLPHVADAWIDPDYIDEKDGERGKVGYEINFNRYFYKYSPPRDLRDIDVQMKAVGIEISSLLDSVAKQQTLIAHAVTKGLDQNVPLKESGIEWIGHIPAHWNVKRAKYLFSLAKRPPQEFDEIVTAFRDGQVTLRTNRRTDGFTNALKEAGYQGVRKGDLVIHAMDAFAGAVGVSDSDGKCTPVYSCCVPNIDAASEYYAHCVRTMATTGWIESLSKGIRERSTDFRWAMFADQALPVPPIEEQRQIADFIAQQTKRINEIIEKTEFLIELMREHRLALITAASTGKIDLRKI
ncbi:MAG: hsdM [Nitrosospira multiformis]|jgi:type I restriction enzyme M protein|nr:hsdM [Nitrosospira multiformis]